MKRYKNYMDGVEPSADLHDRLMSLDTHKGKNRWLKYASVAAALVLVVGAGAFGISRLGGNTELGDLEPTESTTAIGEVAMEPGGAQGSTPSIMGGYEVPSSDGLVVSYYMLPLIRYSQVSGGSAASLAPPVGVERRELTEEEIWNLLGGEAAIVTHLDWGGFTMSGYVMAYEDGTVWRAHLFGKGEYGYFTLTMSPGAVPADCCVVVAEEGEENVTDVWGVEVTGAYGGIYGEGANREVWLPESREVSFAANGVGCRFTFYGPEGESAAVEEMVARFVRLAIVDGLELDALIPGWEPEPVESSVLGDASPSQGPELSTPAYDPNA